MAIINKIRKNQGLNIGIIVGVLILFVLGSDMLRLHTFFTTRDVVGKIAGKRITLAAYQECLEALQRNSVAQHNRGFSEKEKKILHDQVWKDLLEKRLYQKEYKAIGLKVSQDELVDIVRGSHIHPMITNSTIFQDPQTGAFSKEKLIDYLKILSKLPEMYQNRWHCLEQDLVKNRCKEKLVDLMKHSLFTNTLEKQHKQWALAHSLQVKYLYIPYATLTDKIYVSDLTQRGYLRMHRNEYKMLENRSIKYISFPIRPTEEDRLLLQRELQQLMQEFEKTNDDKAFATSYTEGKATSVQRCFTADQLPKALVAQKNTLHQGNVIGPVIADDCYTIYKITAIHTGKSPLYEVTSIEKKLVAGEYTRDKVLKKADQFVSTAKRLRHLEAYATQEGLPLYEAKIDRNNPLVGHRKHAQEIVHWLFQKASLWEVSPIFMLEDECIVAAMLSKEKEGIAPLRLIYRDIQARVSHEEKAKIIATQLQTITQPSLEEIALAYGQDATVQSANLKFDDDRLPGAGAARRTIGNVCSLQVGERTVPIGDENGVLVVELIDRKQEAVSNEEMQYRDRIAQMLIPWDIQRGLEELAHVKDDRYKFY